MLPPEVPVLIVGAGPSGTMLALLLERLGVEAVVVERRDGPQAAPAAHVVNARTLEICRAAGVESPAIAAACTPPSDAGFVDWVMKLGGEPLGRLPFEQQGDEQLEVTPTPLRNLSQNRFEPILQAALATQPRFGSQWESAEADEGGVTSRLRERESGEIQRVRSKFLVAADGAGSRVRNWLGIELEGPEKIESFVMIHFEAKLRAHLPSPPALLHFVTDPECAGVFVVHDLDREAVYMLPYDDERESLADYPPARCRGLVRSALEDPDLDFRVKTVSSWAMTCQVAKSYRKGRCFLIGDAAHRFPPTGGLGLNSGVQDAHNLAWKLAFVLSGRSPAALLDSYEAERRPVAQHNANQSLKNALKLIAVPQELGVLEPGGNTRAAVDRVISDPERRRRVEAAIADQAEHFDMPGLQLGFGYDPASAQPEPRVFVPSGEPGRRLPHAWMSEPGASLLDRVPLGALLLVAGPEGEAWRAAAQALEGIDLTFLLLSKGELPELPRWLESAGIEASGALLVRPDQHVAWRSRRDAGCSGLGQAVSDALRGASFR